MDGYLARGEGLTGLDPLVPTVFHEPWWLDAASEGAWQQVTATSGGRVVGRFPFVLHRRSGLRVLNAPPSLAFFLGPAIDPGAGAACTRQIKTAQIMRELLDQMPPTSGFCHKMHGGIGDMLVFQERAYDVSVQFTSEIAPAPEAELWRRMRDKTRNVIRRAQETLTVAELTDAAEFVAAYTANLRAAGKRNHYSGTVIGNLITEAGSRRQGHLLGARNQAGDLVAAIFAVWDARTAYYMLTTRSPQAGNGAVSLLLWTAIRQSSARGLVFDFAGVGGHGSALFYPGFGGTVAPRYIASRYGVAHAALGWVRERFRAEKRPHTFC